MKILHIVSNISLRSGVMSVIMNYYRNMNTEDFSFDFLYFDDREITYKEQIEKLGGRFYKFERSKNPLKLFVKINRFIKEHINDYQIIHIHEIYLIGALLGIKNRNIKIISHAHTTKFSENKLSSIRNRIAAIPNIFIPDYYFACSSIAGEKCFGKRFKKNGHVIYNAIDISKFQPNDRIRNAMRKELKISDKYVIGHVGNFNVQKNHFFLIQIFYELQKIKNNAVLVLVGDGEMREQVLEKCKELDIEEKVIYLGIRNDVNEVMNIFDCFVLPSIYEGLGIVLIEAQAIGIPCVFSNCVPKEANIFAKNNRILSLKNNSKLWAEAIIEIENKSLDEKKISKQICVAGYNIKTEAKKLEELYKSIAIEGEKDE